MKRANQVGQSGPGLSIALRLTILATVTALSAGWATATNVGLSTIEQPINLVAESDPARIPLGPVAVEANYHYGRGPVISAPRPGLHGAMEWKGGSELNQNLAHVFGIEVADHDLPHSPAVIRLKTRPAPAYSPYSREQVLIATIHCLMRSNQGTPKSPIQIRIESEAGADEALAKKYSKSYVNGPDRPEDPPVDITPVGDSRLETDAMGVTRVVFPEVKAEAPKARPPVLIPFRFSGEGAPDNPTWQLIPVWTGTSHSPDESLATLGRPWPLFYDRFQPGSGHPPEMNALFAAEPRGSIADFRVSSSETAIEAEFQYLQADTGTVAATVLALVAGSKPTAARPLIVTLNTHASNPPEWVATFQKTPGWEVIENETSPRKSSIRLRCRFVWDAEATRLVEGAVPDVEIVRTTRGPLYAEIPVLPVKKDAEEEAEKDTPER